MKTKQEQIVEMAVIGCVRNPQAHTVEECAKCDFKQGSVMLIDTPKHFTTLVIEKSTAKIMLAENGTTNKFYTLKAKLNGLKMLLQTKTNCVIIAKSPSKSLRKS